MKRVVLLIVTVLGLSGVVLVQYQPYPYRYPYQLYPHYRYYTPYRGYQRPVPGFRLRDNNHIGVAKEAFRRRSEARAYAEQRQRRENARVLREQAYRQRQMNSP